MAQSSQQSRQMNVRANIEQHKLQTESYGNSVVHAIYESDASGQQIVKAKTTWNRENRLGSGSFGSVWREVEEGGEIRVVKILSKPDLSIRKIDYTREVEALIESSDHPDYFVKFMGWFEDEKSIFLVMEYLEGGDLGQYIKMNGPRPEREAKEITKQILQGLVILHHKEICHRDLKPQNILIASTSPMWVKICDFGISKRKMDTCLETNCGTRSYRAPEQQRGVLPGELATQISDYTNLVDIWALGVLVHKILTSEIAFLCRNQQGFISESEMEDTTDMMQPFIDMGLLVRYCRGMIQFPVEGLQENQVSEEGISFIKKLLIADPNSRVSARMALRAPWLTGNDDTLHGADANPKPASASDRTTLQDAVERGQIKVVKLLLDDGANVNAEPTSIWGQTALQAAAESGYLDITKLLLDSGADIDYRPADSWTALQMAAREGRVETVKLLLDRGAEVNAEPASASGRTALQVAAERGRIEVAQLLLDNGANVNSDPAPVGGRTALQAAAERGRLEVAKLLVGAGADIDASPGGKTALQLAASKRQFKMIKLLLDSRVNSMPTNFHDGQAAAAGVGRSHSRIDSRIDPDDLSCVSDKPRPRDIPDTPETPEPRCESDLSDEWWRELCSQFK